MIDPEIPGKLFQNFVYFGPRNSKKAFDLFWKGHNISHPEHTRPTSNEPDHKSILSIKNVLDGLTCQN